jgi:hypothetical protein
MRTHCQARAGNGRLSPAASDEDVELEVELAAAQEPVIESVGEVAGQRAPVACGSRHPGYLPAYRIIW